MKSSIKYKFPLENSYGRYLSSLTHHRSSIRRRIRITRALPTIPTTSNNNRRRRRHSRSVGVSLPLLRRGRRHSLPQMQEQERRVSNDIMNHHVVRPAFKVHGCKVNALARALVRSICGWSQKKPALLSYNPLLKGQSACKVNFHWPKRLPYKKAALN